MDQVRYVFFDVGNVLLSEELAVAFFCHDLWKDVRRQAGPTLSYQEFLCQCQTIATEKTYDGPAQQVALRYLSQEALGAFLVVHRTRERKRFDDVTPVIPGIRDLLGDLRSKVGLGIIANQYADCEVSLKRRGLLDYFSVVGISEGVSLSKPDPAFFRWACARAGCAPEACVMVGDRYDNDVLPAKQVGMATVWLRWEDNRQKGLRPVFKYQRLYLESVGSVRPGAVPNEAALARSDYVVHSIAELGMVLRRLAS